MDYPQAMSPSAWEAVFFLLALKIPLVFVGLVVWRAIRATPDDGTDGGNEVRAPVSDTPDGPPPRARSRRPAGGPVRRPLPQRPSGTRTLDPR